MRSPRARVLSEGRFQLRPRPVVLAGVAIGPADEDVGRRDRPIPQHASEQRLGVSGPFQPQVIGGDQERQLGVLAGEGSGLGQPLQRRVNAPIGRQRAGQQAAALAVARVFRHQGLQRLRGRSRIAAAKLRGGQRLQARQGLDAKERRVGERLARFGHPAFGPLHGRGEEPALEQDLAIEPLGAFEVPGLETALGLGDGGFERGHGIGPAAGDGRGTGEREAQADARAAGSPRERSPGHQDPHSMPASAVFDRHREVRR